MKHSELMVRVSEVQDSMLKSAPSWCSESDLDSLRYLIELTVTFYYYLRDGDRDDRDLPYHCQSALWATDSFCSVARIYGLIGDTTKSQIAQDTISAASLKESYSSKYQQFSADVSFEERCRLLLDLFRLQIIFAAMNYN